MNKVITLVVVGTLWVTVSAATIKNALEPHIPVGAFNSSPPTSSAVVVSGNSAIGNAEFIVASS